MLKQFKRLYNFYFLISAIIFGKQSNKTLPILTKRKGAELSEKIAKVFEQSMTRDEPRDDVRSHLGGGVAMIEATRWDACGLWGMVTHDKCHGLEIESFRWNEEEGAIRPNGTFQSPDHDFNRGNGIPPEKALDCGSLLPLSAMQPCCERHSPCS